MKKEALLFIACVSGMLLTGCGQLTWVNGYGGSAKSNYPPSQNQPVYKAPHYHVVSGTDKKGEFRYLSKGSYPGLTDH